MIPSSLIYTNNGELPYYTKCIILFVPKILLICLTLLIFEIILIYFPFKDLRFVKSIFSLISANIISPANVVMIIL